MTILVAGSAAHEDLILTADRQPSPSEVATLATNPGSQGIWLPGGAARTISLAARAQGANVRLWYPQPVTDRAIALLEEMGVDISQTPVQDIDAVRCLLVYGNDGRLAWSTRLLSVVPVYIDRLLAGVTHTVISPVWGPWADILVEACNRRAIPVSLIGDASPQARACQWHTVILDAGQFSALGDIQCQTESVPAALGIADFARGNPTLAIEIAGNLRGDTDTVAAMAGAVCGAFAGASALPKEWGALVETTNNFSSRQWAERLQALAGRDSAGAKRSVAA